MIVINNLVGGWPTPLKNDGVPNWMEKDKMFQTNNQIGVSKNGDFRIYGNGTINNCVA